MVANQEKILYSLCSFFCIAYMCFSRNFEQMSLICQLVIVILLMCNRFLKSSSIPRFSLIWMSILPFVAIAQGVYVINYFFFVILYIHSRYAEKQKIYKSFIYYATAVCSVSIIVYLLDGAVFYENRPYQNQIIEGVGRLLGADGSPAMISVITGLAFLLAFRLKLKRITKVSLSIYFLLTLLWTGSKTGVISLFVAFICSYLHRAAFCFVMLFFQLSPVLMLYIYEINVKWALIIEQISSYRIVNWYNAFYHYISQPLYNVMLGIGHMPELKEAYLERSIGDGYYVYSYVTYPESVYLRVLINFGVLIFIWFLIYSLNRNFKLTTRPQKLLVSFITLCGISYDGVFSIQYFFIASILLAQYRITHNKVCDA